MVLESLHSGFPDKFMFCLENLLCPKPSPPLIFQNYPGVCRRVGRRGLRLCAPNLSNPGCSSGLGTLYIMLPCHLPFRSTSCNPGLREARQRLLWQSHIIVSVQKQNSNQVISITLPNPQWFLPKLNLSLEGIWGIAICHSGCQIQVGKPTSHSWNVWV